MLVIKWLVWVKVIGLDEFVLVLLCMMNRLLLVIVRLVVEVEFVSRFDWLMFSWVFELILVVV